MAIQEHSLESRNHPKSSVDYSPESWKIDPSLLSSEARNLWAQENYAPITIERDVSLRPKILDACGMTCVFCHNEGTPVVSEARAHAAGASESLGRVSIFAAHNGVNFLPGRMSADHKLQTALSSLNQAVGVQEIHLTGGEPSLHPELPDIINMAQQLGLRVKMTSNGENPKVIERCAAAGLEKIIFSIFGTNAAELSQVQHHKFQNVHLAERKIDSLKRSIATANEHGVKTVANVVIPGPGHEARIAAILNEFNHVSLRLLNSLDDGDASFMAIYELLAQMQAQPTEVKLTAGSSNARINYKLPDGQPISFKQIRPARFNQICDDCAVDKAGKCEEGFYGLRLYVDQQNDYMVGLCIQRMDLAMPLDEFLASDLPGEINHYRLSEEQAMREFFNNSPPGTIIGRD